MDAPGNRRYLQLARRACYIECSRHDRRVSADGYYVATAEFRWYQYDLYGDSTRFGISVIAVHEPSISKQGGNE